MSAVVTWVRRRSRLGALIDAAGGKSVGAAIRAADDNLAPLRARADGVIAARVDELAAVAAAGDASTGGVRQAYRAASAILDAASPFGRDDICAAARNLCDITDDGEDDARFDWRIVDVHVRTLRLLLSLAPEQIEARQAVLAGLEQVAAHKLSGAARG